MARSGGRRLLVALVALGVGGAALFVPAPTPAPPVGSESTAFRWDAELLFAELEAEFARLGESPERDIAAEVVRLSREGDDIVAALPGSAAAPHADLVRLATIQFRLAVRGAAQPSLLEGVEAAIVRFRVGLMSSARAWPMDRATQESLYRIVAGGRIALDEALVQAGLETLEPLRIFQDVPSTPPSIVVEGVRVHSGDILLSRGGAPTSALIARGNDFPSTFSHAALAHVDAETGVGTVVESLIETGSVTSTVAEYVEGKKHRILVLRLRPDHPALIDDPLLPHRAAEAMLSRVREDHIPYDFAMEWDDDERAFCSEIVFQPYRDLGVELWGLRSSMSSPGLVRWLAMMGVREFTSLVPSDAELDPRLAAVVEWRDAPALMDYRLDNAITDALLEAAEGGADLGYPGSRLGPARLLKAYSVVQDLLGGVPTIPEGMNAQTALRVDALVSTVHPAIKEELVRRAASYVEANGLEPPYWALVDLARESLAAVQETLAPALVLP